MRHDSWSISAACTRIFAAHHSEFREDPEADIVSMFLVMLHRDRQWSLQGLVAYASYWKKWQMK